MGLQVTPHTSLDPQVQAWLAGLTPRQRAEAFARFGMTSPQPAQATSVPFDVALQAAQGPETSVNPLLLADLDRLAAAQTAPAPRPRPATTRSSKGVDPATFARPYAPAPGVGGFGARFREMWRANKGNNQRLALERMIAGSRRT